MKLIIKNFGPIAEGEIDLNKDFYLFVGYNNSGKTYVSNLLWSVFQIKTLYKFIFEEKFDEIDFKNSDTFEINENLLNIILDKFSFFIKNKILPNNFKSNKFKNAEFIFKTDINKIIEYIDSNKTFIENDSQIEIKDNKNDLIKIKIKENVFSKFKETELNKEQIKISVFFWFLFNSMLNGLTNTFFLPAGRNFHPNYFIQMFRYEKLLSDETEKIFRNNNKIDNNDLFKVRKLLRKLYKETDNELFKNNYDLFEDSNNEPVDYYKDILKELEKIIGGNIVVDKDNRKFLFNYNEKNNPLDMYMASSSVNQLTELYLYLKYWIKKDHNFLFIDEPEINLHPKNQIKLLDLLIQFSSINDNKVLITTHSPLLTKAINNYLLFSKIENKTEVSEQLQISTTSLNSENTAIYFFDKREDEQFGSIKEYKIGEYGTLFNDFNGVEDRIEEINDELSDFYFNQMNNK